MSVNINELRRSTNKLLSTKILNSFEIDKEVILYYTLNYIDFEIANRLCEKFITQTNNEYINLGLICIGHMSRIYTKIPSSKILEILYEIHTNKNNIFWGVVDDTLDDISIFLKIRKNLIFDSIAK